MEDLQGGALALEHRYDIGKPAGTIGFTSVYRGSQHPFGREVAIIVFDVLAEHGAPAPLVARIRGSAEAYARLEHPGVVRAIDVGELEANLPFVVIDRAPGVRLATHLDRIGTMTPEETYALVGRLAEILEAAHDKDVVHGSLAPAWIHVDPDAVERAEVAFWGLGLTVAEIRSIEGAYMSFDAVCALAPEMFEEEADPSVAGDVYALAAIAYRALAGIHPYFDDVSDTSDGLIRMQSQDPASLEEFGIEPEIATVVDRGLSRDPEDRWSSPAAFAAAFGAAIAPEPVEPSDEDEASANEASRDSHDDRSATAFPEEADDLRYAPSPKGGLLAAAIGLLIVTNVAWFLVNPSPGSTDATTGVATEVLPNGVQIETMPPGAKVLELREDGERELGETPMIIDPTIRAGSVMRLRLKHRGHADAEIEVRRLDGTDEVVVLLPNTDE